MNYFLEIYGTLPRAGPGSNELTRKALGMMSNLPEAPHILDVGCGPGMQTIELLKSTRGTVIALDFLPEMIDRVQSSAESAGVTDRLKTLIEDMHKMVFPEESFDVIWSEGAIYNIGFEDGLKKLKKFLKPGGYLAVSEAVWLKDNPPPEAVAFWKDYPEIGTVEAKLEMIRRTGYRDVGHFVFPPVAWTKQYYDPMEARIAEKVEEWRGIAEAEEVLREAKTEIATFRQCQDSFSYAFFIMRK